MLTKYEEYYKEKGEQLKRNCVFFNKIFISIMANILNSYKFIY